MISAIIGQVSDNFWPGVLPALDQGACGGRQPLLLISFYPVIHDTFAFVVAQCLYIVVSHLKCDFCEIYIKETSSISIAMC